MKTQQILSLNKLGTAASEAFGARYAIVEASDSPIAIVLRSYKMHDYALPKSVLAIGRAGAGVNNIPHANYAKSGVVVFNTPGANANAVKELVILSLLLCARDCIGGIVWAQTLKGGGVEVEKTVEKGKSNFGGDEISGKNLGVIGLGAIGVLVANASAALGMHVIGYDPFVSDYNKAQLHNTIKIESDLNALLPQADYLTLHAPLTEGTKGLINAKTISAMRRHVNIINCSRGELCDTAAIIDALKSGKVNKYVTDFPSDNCLCVPGIIPIPHLGASTHEAEENCARMAAQQIVDYIESGNITNAVNYPAVMLKRTGKQRITIMYNVGNDVLASVTGLLGGNIAAIANAENAAHGYIIVDVKKELDKAVIEKLSAIDGIVRIRVI